MGRIVGLDEVESLSGDQRFGAYACLDATGTREIYDRLKPTLTEKQEKVYRWTIAQLGPAVTMGRRGTLVDTKERDALIKEIETRREKAIKACQEHPLVREHWDGKEIVSGKCPKATRKDGQHKWPVRVPDGPDKCCVDCGISRIAATPFQPGSNDQTAHLLYDLLKVQASPGRTGERSVDEESLDSVRRRGRALQETKTGKEQFKSLEGLTELLDSILEVRDCVKQLSFLRMPLSDDNRFHSTFKPFGAWTGRWASRRDPFEVGQNAQNIGKQHRHILVADPGYEMLQVDLKTAESLVVAMLAGDEQYIEAHKGDVHTFVCRLVWPELPWTGDLKKDKAIAKSNYPEWDEAEGHDYRFQSKRQQHGSNYGLTPHGMARQAHIPLVEAKNAQAKYFEAFPRILQWHRYTYKAVREGLPIMSPFGHDISLMGRYDDDHTFRQALAFPPQRTIGDVCNTGIFRLWSRHDPDLLQLLMQVHDAAVMQYEVGNRDRVIEAVKECFAVDVPITDIYGKERVCRIPIEIEIGKNWGNLKEIDL